MLDNVRLRGELAHIHRTLNALTTTGAVKLATEELRRATGTTTAAGLWQSLFADCLRVVYSAAAADEKIGDDEIEAIYDLVFSIARHYANAQPQMYGEFEAIEHEQAARRSATGRASSSAARPPSKARPSPSSATSA
jgi:hypothetical protein